MHKHVGKENLAPAGPSVGDANPSILKKRKYTARKSGNERLLFRAIDEDANWTLSRFLYYTFNGTQDKVNNEIHRTSNAVAWKVCMLLRCYKK